VDTFITNTKQLTDIVLPSLSLGGTVTRCQ